MVTDPIADFLIRLQNAQSARKDSTVVPNSNITRALADILLREGYIGSIDKRAIKTPAGKKNPQAGGTFGISLLYKNGRPVIAGSKRISKPSRRMYMSVREIKPVKRGYGLLVLSTPAGILTGKEAREKRVGGEALFEIW